MTKLIDFAHFLRENESPPIKSKPEETQRRKVMGLRFHAFFGTMIARLSIIAKPHKSGDAKPDIRKLTDEQDMKLVRIGRLTERQTQGNLWAQSYGSKVERLRLPDCRRVLILG